MNGRNRRTYLLVLALLANLCTSVSVRAEPSVAAEAVTRAELERERERVRAQPLPGVFWPITGILVGAGVTIVGSLWLVSIDSGLCEDSGSCRTNSKVISGSLMASGAAMIITGWIFADRRVAKRVEKEATLRRIDERLKKLDLRAEPLLHAGSQRPSGARVDLTLRF
jgi:hypothetical protein